MKLFLKQIYLLLALLWGLLSAGAATAPVKLAWDANPAAEAITGYVVYYQQPGGPVLSLRTGNVLTAELAGLAPGIWQVSLAAINAVDTGPASAPLAVTVVELPKPPTAPAGLRVVEIQTSSNLRDWETIALIPQDPARAPAEFVRARLSQLAGAAE